jgi:large subunit ribosomal protein L6
MSRIGKKPIEIPSGVTVKMENGEVVVEGPKGSLKQKIEAEIEIEFSQNQILVTRKSDGGRARALHGTTRQLLFNMVKGVTEGWEKTLEVIGTGYRAGVSGQNLTLALGFSHPVEITPPPEISFKVAENKITVSGINKALVGQMAAKIRATRPPDPYKGKGIRYLGEVLKLKPGKQAKIGAVGVASKTGGK